MVVVANLFYIVVFLLLIFSSALPFGLDNYTIKKTLPKFIGAVILTQFSFVITVAIVDFFNLMGRVVPNMIFGLGSVAVGGACSGNMSNIGGLNSTLELLTGGLIAIAAFFLVIVLAVVLFFAMLVAFVYMAMRYLIIYILIIAAPLAFACWVLPGTNKLWSAWWTNFIKLNAMIIVITAMLSLSVVLSQVLIITTGEC